MAEISTRTGRGTIYLVEGKGEGKYKLDPEISPKSKGGAGDTLEYAILFTGYTLNEQEITAKASCLNDQRVMYSFGKGFGDIAIIGEILCGNPADQGGGQKIIQDYYEDNRVHVLEDTVTLSASDATYEFYLTGLSILQYNVNLEILGFRLTGTLAE